MNIQRREFSRLQVNRSRKSSQAQKLYLQAERLKFKEAIGKRKNANFAID
jgi:hypothetical protein